MSAPTPLPKDDDRILWLAVRRALLAICAAIEKRYGLCERDNAA